MDSKPLDSAGVYKLEHTSSGEPYIALTTRSETPIYLTKYYPKDPPDVEAALSLPEVNFFLISAPTPYTLADAEWWVNSQLATSSNYPLQILRAGAPDESGTLIGSVSLMPPDSAVLATLREKGILPDSHPNGKECELGYYLRPDYRGKGIVKAGVKGILAYGKVEHGVTNVLIRVADDNEASLRVVENMGKEYWVRTEQEDHVVDWPEAKGGGRKNLLSWRWMAPS
jgi:RimJ/RimL family protein N-acetyltransferase